MANGEKGKGRSKNQRLKLLYLLDYLLENTDETVTRIALTCGFGTSSHFGKLFLERFGLTPLQHRRSWQDRDMNRR